MNHEIDRKCWFEEESAERLFGDRRIELYRKAYRTWDDRILTPYYSLKLGNYVLIVAVDTEGNYICVRQFRQGVQCVTTEFPAGGIEANPSSGEYAEEELLKNAKRELREETGYTSGQWTQLFAVPANATLANNTAYIFLAENCVKTSEQKLDETEYLEVRLYSPDELDSLVRQGGFQHAVHMLAWYLAREKREAENK